MDPETASIPRRALAQFVRAHRLRLTPAAAGLPAGTRRRTPGLRREEVAQLAGISTTWYTWMEQARAVSVSPHALSRLAAALDLSPAERAYLFELADKRDPDLSHPVGEMDAPPALVAAVNAVATPAYLLDRLWRARTWNPPAAALFTGWLDVDAPGNDRSLLRYMFLNQAARALVVDWEDRARRLLAEFRLEQGRHLDDPDTAALVADLQARSPLVRAAWDEQAVVGREGGLRTFAHPTMGRLAFEQVAFNLSSRPELKLVILVQAAGPLATE
jgi:transcriptional regulator with XRE-family HTH domain